MREMTLTIEQIVNKFKDPTGHFEVIFTNLDIYYFNQLIDRLPVLKTLVGFKKSVIEGYATRLEFALGMWKDIGNMPLNAYKRGSSYARIPLVTIRMNTKPIHNIKQLKCSN